jgi:hypothetical protein
MTLKEKFEATEVFPIKEVCDELLRKRIKIADEFAIGFAVWCIKKRIDFFDSTEIGETYTIDGNVSKYKMNELLEIYKKDL